MRPCRDQRRMSWEGPEGPLSAEVLVSNNADRLGTAVGWGTRPRRARGRLGITMLTPIDAASNGSPHRKPAMQQWTAPSFEIGSEEPLPRELTARRCSWSRRCVTGRDRGSAGESGLAGTGARSVVADDPSAGARCASRWTARTSPVVVEHPGNPRGWKASRLTARAGGSGWRSTAGLL